MLFSHIMYNTLLIVVQFMAVLFAISVHESAHAWTADKFGDPTAKNQGRVTLNPIAHIDLVGTIIFPAFLILMKAPVFGWAKPVMVNPYNLRDPRKHGMYISAAGPLSNILTAVVGSVIFLVLKSMKLVDPVPIFYVTNKNPDLLTVLFFYLILISIYLAFFNLLPIPPLDGSGILEGLLKGEALVTYHKIRPYGIIILVGIVWFGGLRIIAGPIIALIRAILMWG